MDTVSWVADRPEAAGAPFEGGRGDVLEHEHAVAEVPGGEGVLGEGVLDGSLAAAPPVHRAVEVVLVGSAHRADLSQAARSRLGPEAPRAGELGASDRPPPSQPMGRLSQPVKPDTLGGSARRPGLGVPAGTGPEPLALPGQRSPARGRGLVPLVPPAPVGVPAGTSPRGRPRLPRDRGSGGTLVLGGTAGALGASRVGQLALVLASTTATFGGLVTRTGRPPGRLPCCLDGGQHDRRVLGGEAGRDEAMPSSSVRDQDQRR